MSWCLSCLLVAAMAIWQAHGAPLIEDATFTDIDLVAEDSQPNAVYVAAPTRVKRTPQYFGAKCGFHGCGGFGGFGSFGYNNNYAYNNYAYQQQQQPYATVVHHTHHRDAPLPPVVVPQQQYRPTQPAAVVTSHQHQPPATSVVHLAHYQNRPSPPVPPFTGYKDPAPPGPGANGGNPFDYYSSPPYGAPHSLYGGPHYGPPAHGPPGHGPPGYGPPGRGPPGHRHPGRGPPNHGLSNSGVSPNFNSEPQPQTNPSMQSVNSQPIPQSTTSAPTAAPSNAPIPTQLTLAPIPPTILTTTISTTTPEPMYDIDIRFGN